MSLKKEALRYHREPRPGKIEVVPTKPPSPGRSEPGLHPRCGRPVPGNPPKPGSLLRVHRPQQPGGCHHQRLGGSWFGQYRTSGGQTGDGGQGRSFQTLCQPGRVRPRNRRRRPGRIHRHRGAKLEPTFGGINLEDIRAPECFYIEEQLKARMQIPVFHDDQHGTAIISGAALLNACHLTGRRMADIRLVINGAGAAALACARMYCELGVRPAHLLVVDSRGVIHAGRTEGMNPYKRRLRPTPRPAPCWRPSRVRTSWWAFR